MEDTVTPRTPCHVPWCTAAPHSPAGRIVHSRDLDTIETGRWTLGVVLLQAEHHNRFDAPLVRVFFDGEECPEWGQQMNIPARAAGLLGTIITSLTVHAYGDFGAALIRGAGFAQRAEEGPR